MAQPFPYTDDLLTADRGSERFRLQPLTPELEAPMVAMIRRSLSRLADRGLDLGATRRKLDHFYESYTRDGSVYLVLVDRGDNCILGGVGLVPFAGLPPGEGIGEIRELLVDTPFRGQGLGLLLMKAVFATALRLNYKRLYLETTDEMQDAQTLFVRHGFKPVSLQQKEGQKSGRRDQPIIRQAGQPAFYVWEDESLRSEPVRPDKEPGC